MDIKREGVAKRRRVRWSIYAVLGLGVLSLGSWRLYKLQPAAPTVERATVWVDAVKRGPMLRDVKGIGTLVPEDIVWNRAFQVEVQFHLGQPFKPAQIRVRNHRHR